MSDFIGICELCGEPMPPGEEMFKFHGYSCECPKPLLPRPVKRTVEELERELSAAQATLAKFESAKREIPKEPSYSDTDDNDGLGAWQQYARDLRTFAAAQTVLLADALECMQAFTDSEGDMPENTGEFRDLKRVMLLIDAALAAGKGGG